jgi:hypothetical protein
MVRWIVPVVGQGLLTLQVIAIIPVLTLLNNILVLAVLYGIQAAFATIGGIVNFRKGAEELLFYCWIPTIKLLP